MTTNNPTSPREELARDPDIQAVMGVILDYADNTQHDAWARLLERLTPPRASAGQLEKIARIVAPNAWEFADKWASRPNMAAEIKYETGPSLRTASAILDALSEPVKAASPEGEAWRPIDDEAKNGREHLIWRWDGNGPAIHYGVVGLGFFDATDHLDPEGSWADENGNLISDPLLYMPFERPSHALTKQFTAKSASATPPASERAEVVADQIGAFFQSGVIAPEAPTAYYDPEHWRRVGPGREACSTIYPNPAGTCRTPLYSAPAPDQQVTPANAHQSVSLAYRLGEPVAWLVRTKNRNGSWGEPWISSTKPDHDDYVGTFGVDITPLCPIAPPEAPEAPPGEEYETALKILTDMDAEAMPLEKRAAILATMIARPTDADRAWAMSVAKDLPEAPVVTEEPNHLDGKIREFILNWFAPWGSWKTAWWETEVSDDVEMSDANALKHLRNLATKGTAV